MKFHAVTTCHAAGWEQYGRRMAQSFRQFWPKDVTLTVYAEGFTPDVPGLDVRALPAWLDQFKRRHKRNSEAHGEIGGKYRFRGDCVKFAHKVAAITDCAASLDDGVLIALDADIVSFAPVSNDWLASLFPEPSYIAWLDRRKFYPECGFVMYRCGHPAHRDFVRGFQELYTSDSVLALAETHDSYVLQQHVKDWESIGAIEPPVSLSGSARQHHHVFVASQLGSRMDHLKGNRKVAGKSDRSETIGRSETYWTS